MVSLESSRFTESVPRFLEIKNRSQKKLRAILNPGIHPSNMRKWFEQGGVTFKDSDRHVNGTSSKPFSADHSMFHSTYEVRMPVHCAKEQHSRNQGEGLNANTYVPIGMGDMNYCNH